MVLPAKREENLPPGAVVVAAMKFTGGTAQEKFLEPQAKKSTGKRARASNSPSLP